MKCTECNYKRAAENSHPDPVPGHAFEVREASHLYVVKWLARIIVLLVVLLVGSNLAWIIRERQMERVTTTTTTEYTIEAEQEAENGNNYAVNGDFYGEAEN